MIISVKNLRSLVDSGDIELNDITFFLGQNSSGKSSILRLFPMLRESSRHELRGPVLWFDENYDYGSFASSISRHCSDGLITISFAWDKCPDYFESRYSLNEYIIRQSLEGFHVDMSIAKDGDTVYLKELVIKFKLVTGKNNDVEDDIVVIFSGKRNNSFDVMINGAPVGSEGLKWRYRSNGLLPSIFPLSSWTVHENMKLGDDGLALDNVHSMLLFSYAWVFNENHFSMVLSKVSEEKIVLSANELKQDQYSVARERLYLNSLNKLLELVDSYLSVYFGQTFYITPLRYNFQRYMRNRDLSVDSVESSGKNVMEYILSLDDEELVDFQSFINRTIGITAEVIGEENKSIIIKTKDGEEDNIVDVGYGISQVLPIATTLWDRAFKKGKPGIPDTIVIEQPEVHLHPRMQGDLARLFVETLALAKRKKKKLNIIIETHSSVLINRVGRYIYNYSHTMHLHSDEGENGDMSKLNPREVSLYLFEKKSGISIVKKTMYNKLGRIESWPIGFMD